MLKKSSLSGRMYPSYEPVGEVTFIISLNSPIDISRGVGAGGITTIGSGELVDPPPHDARKIDDDNSSTLYFII
jgi:hypothetical protein